MYILYFVYLKAILAVCRLSPVMIKLKSKYQLIIIYIHKVFQSIQSQTFFILYLGTAALAVMQSIDSVLNIFQDTQSEITG